MLKLYEKVGKLNRTETDGILYGLVYVQPKMDGTNGSVWFDNGMHYASRKREITPGNDNAGFAKYVENHEAINQYLMDNQHHILYGEWLVPHTCKGYTDEAWRRFYVFDVFDTETLRWLTPDEFYAPLKDAGVDVVGYHKVLNPTSSEINTLRTLISGFMMRAGEEGEGVVLKNYSYRNKFGVCTFGKYLNETFAASTGRAKGAKRLRDCPVEEELAERMVDRGLVLKTQSKIEVAEGGYSQRMIGRLLETVWHDAIEEELYDALKKMKWPTVDFKVLKGQIYQRTKAEAKEFF